MPIKKVGGYLVARNPDETPIEARELEAEGCAILRGALSPSEVETLASDITRVFEELPPDNRGGTSSENFRYEMLNRSAPCQAILSHPRILAVIEPLLGEDCHVIANTAWRNPPKPNDPAQMWHVDAGPHIPLADGILWPTDIPHPVFCIGVHIFLKDCGEGDGPTGALPGSHLSGRFPPKEDRMNEHLTYNGRSAHKLLCSAGDVAFFVSDVWHRRLPTGPNDRGRFFLQVHYGRRDIAQRIHTTAVTNHLSTEAIARAHAHAAAEGETGSMRAKTIVGLHEPYFYDG